MSEILQRHQHILDRLFGAANYEIEAHRDEVATIRTPWMQVSFTCDWRDQFISSSIRPLRVPPENSVECTTNTLLRYCGIHTAVRSRGIVDDQQIIDELNRIRPLVDLLKDERKSRDAVSFVRGYNSAYTDYMSGKWDT